MVNIFKRHANATKNGAAQLASNLQETSPAVKDYNAMLSAEPQSFSSFMSELLDYYNPKYPGVVSHMKHLINQNQHMPASASMDNFRVLKGFAKAIIDMSVSESINCIGQTEIKALFENLLDVFRIAGSHETITFDGKEGIPYYYQLFIMKKALDDTSMTHDDYLALASAAINVVNRVFLYRNRYIAFGMRKEFDAFSNVFTETIPEYTKAREAVEIEKLTISAGTNNEDMSWLIGDFVGATPTKVAQSEINKSGKRVEEERSNKNPHT